MSTVFTDLDAVIKYVSIPSAIVAAYTILGIFTRGSTRIFKRLGKRWSYRRKLQKLGCGMSFARFDELLGPPMVQGTEAIGESGHRRYVQIYISKYAYVKAVGTSKDESVQAFAITTRSRWFKLPLKTLTNEQMTGKIPSNSFADFGGRGLWGKRCVIGANRVGYSELFYFGNPGNYQNYILAHNDAAPGKVVAPEGWHNFCKGLLVTDAYDEGFKDVQPAGEWLREFYKDLGPNTLAITDDVRMILNDHSVGVDAAKLRTIPHK